MCDNPVLKKIKGKVKDYTIIHPCGGCMGCRKDKLLLWQARCNSEYIKYRSAFISFTYDDNHLPFNGKYSPFPTLKKDDFHRYIDNISHKIKKIPVFEGCTQDFKFFGCGEYGGLFARPHYHALFFGLDFHDYKKFFYKTWKNGYIKSLPILAGGVRYVCDYVSKQKTGDLAILEYDNNNIERPFMSVSQGIGSDFFLAHRDEIANTGCIKIGSRIVPVPSYYVNLLSSYSLLELENRNLKMLQSFKDSLKKMRIAGFTDYDKYMNYCRKANEMNLYQESIKNGSASRFLYNPVFTSPAVGRVKSNNSPLLRELNNLNVL